MHVYLDNSATTKPLKQVVETMNHYYQEHYGNPSSLHRMGMTAEKGIKESRRTICQSLNIQEKEFYFTSGGTESNNMALFGSVNALKKKGNKIITTCIEHPAVLNICKALEQKGMDVHYLSVNEKGLINIDEFNSVLDEETILISIMYVNNELGTIQPVEQIGKSKRKFNHIYFHVDAVQAYGKIPVRPTDMYIDFLSVSAHKLHGPKGIGGLYIKEGITIPPLLYGGLQERSMRSGTENVPGIIGFSKAVEVMVASHDENIKKMIETKQYLLQGLQDEIQDIKVNSYEDKRCAPHILNVSFLGVRGEVLLHMLEQEGIYISTGSACASNKNAKSHVLKACGLKDKEIEGAIRFSFSFDNNIEQMDYVLEKLKKHVKSIRKTIGR